MEILREVKNQFAQTRPADDPKPSESNGFDEIDAVTLSTDFRKMHVQSVECACPMWKEFEPRQEYLDRCTCSDVQHSEAKINTSQDSTDIKLESLGFSIKTVSDRANVFHYIHPSIMEACSLPSPLRVGDQILQLTCRKRADPMLNVMSMDIVGITSHREVIEALESLISHLHIFTFIIRRKDEEGNIHFFEVHLQVNDANGKIEGKSVEIFTKAPIRGTTLVVLKIYPPEPVGIKLYEKDSSMKAIYWIVTNKTNIKLGQLKSEKLNIERVVLQCFDNESGKDVYLNAFRIRETHLYVTVTGDLNHHSVEIRKHKLEKNQNFPKETLFRHCREIDGSLSTLESLETPGYFLAAGCNNRLILTKLNFGNSTCVQTHMFQIMLVQGENVTNVVHVKPQKSAKTWRRKPIWREWLQKLKFWK